MNTRIHLLYYTMLVMLILITKSACVKAYEKKSDKPNIIIIYTDQQRYNTIHSLGNDIIKTPNLDKLVEEGVAFTHAFVTSPVCTPSRWSLHTGTFTTTHKTYSNHHVSAEYQETSLPEELKKLGYKTVLLGKNHCFLSSEQMDILEEMHNNKNLAEDKRSADKAMPWAVKDDDTHQLVNRAIEIFSRKGNEPVFMWLSFLYPHTPFLCPEPFFSMYNETVIPKPVIEPKGLESAGKPFRQQFHQINNNNVLPYNEEKTMRMKRNYYGMISMVDAEIGRLIWFLEENKLRDNTVIVFTSDHGDYQGDHGMFTKSPAMYDCLTRVPLIFSWKGHINEKQISDALVSSVDIMPTILNLINADIPSQVQGISLKPILEGKNESSGRKYIFSEYGIPGKPILNNELAQRMPDYKVNPIEYDKGLPWEANPVALAGRIRMIRSKEYKLVEEIGGTQEFYDLITDPNELNNIYADEKYKSIKSEMLNALHNWKNNLPGIELDTVPMGEINFSDYLKKEKLKNIKL
jgi:arylsulfatase